MFFNLNQQILSSTNLSLGSYLVGTIIGSLFSLFLVILFLFWIINKKIKKGKQYHKGLAFEKKISLQLSDLALNKHFSFHPGSLYKYNQTTLFEVDAILVTPYALVVIELKSINGKISGDGASPIWKKRTKEKSYQIKSPIIQNNRHLKHLEKLLSFKVPLISLIILETESANLKITNVPEHVLLATHDNYRELLDIACSQLTIKLNKHEIDEINRQLQSHKTTQHNDQKQFQFYTRQA